MNQKQSFPAEVAGEFSALFAALPVEESRFLRDPRPFSVSDEDMEYADHQMKQIASKEHDLYLYNLECTASKWKRKLEFGQWVARKPENRGYFTRQKRRKEERYLPFSKLKVVA